MRTFRPASAILASLCALAQAEAATAKQSEIGDGTQDAFVEGDIVVTARRQAERLQDTPVAVTALSGDQIAKSQILDVAALQAATPNLAIRTQVGDPNSVIITMRGQVQTDGLITLDPAVGLYLDGAYIARSTGGLLNLVDVERVEVLRGPQGTLFGRNTTGGAINIVARKPTNNLEGSLRFRAGNYGLLEATGVANIPLVDGIAALRLVAQRSSHNGYARNAFRSDPLADDELTFVRGSIRLTTSDERLEVVIGGDYTDRDNSGQFSKIFYLGGGSTTGNTINACAIGNNPLCAVAIPGDSVANYMKGGFYTNYGEDRAYTDSASGGASLAVTYDTGAVTLKSISAYRFTRLQRSADLDGTPYTLLTSTGAVDQKQFSQELQLFGSGLDGRLSWIVGGYYFRESGTDGSLTEFTAPPATTGFQAKGFARNQSIAAYGQASFNITEKLRLTAGARYTEDKRLLRGQNRTISLLDGTETCAIDPSVRDTGAVCRASLQAKFDYPSFTLGVDYKATPDILIYASMNRASRAGGFNLRFTNAATATPFDPEEITSYEIGFKSDLLDRRVRLNVAAYYSTYDNIQRTRIALIDGNLVTLIQNAAKAHVYGGEVELTVKPAKGFRLNVAGGLTKPVYDDFTDALGRDRSAEPFLLVPKRTINFGAEYSAALGEGEMTLRFDYDYRSAVFFNPTEIARQPGYGLLNGGVLYELKDKGLSFGIWARNLTNKQYFDRVVDLSGPGANYATYVPGTPRTFGLQAGLDF